MYYSILSFVHKLIVTYGSGMWHQQTGHKYYPPSAKYSKALEWVIPLLNSNSFLTVVHICKSIKFCHCEFGFASVALVVSLSRAEQCSATHCPPPLRPLVIVFRCNSLNFHFTIFNEQFVDFNSFTN